MKIRTALMHGGAIFALVYSGQAAAQETDDSGALTDIVVTAQKREQSLQDVPVSVSVVSGAQVEGKAAATFEDLNASIPNFSVSRNAIQDTVSIRGINSDGQAGTEQSVGIYVDGIFRGRGPQSRYAFLDIDRIEVLRGPQGTLFGKNTIAGALNITSARPTNDFTGSIQGTYEFNHEELGLSGYVSGPLSDSVRGRIAFTRREMDKGWVRNIGYAEDMPQNKEYAVRGSIEADLSDSITLYAKYEHGDYSERGSPYDFVKIGPSLAGAAAAFGLQEINPGFDRITNITNAFNPIPSVPYLAAIDFGSAYLNDGTNDEAALQLDVDLGAGKLTAIYGHSEYEFERDQDADFGPLPVVSFSDREKYSQDSIELRYASDTGGRLEYIFGAYYQSSDLFTQGDTRFNYRFLRALTGNPIFGLPASNPRRLNTLDQNSKSGAVFGQATFNVTDALGLTAGLRYSTEKKKAVQSVDLIDATTGAPATPPPSPPFPPANILFFVLPTESVIHSYNLRRKESQLSPQVQLHWDVTDDAMVFASYSKGAKGGGFNSFALGTNPATPNDSTGAEYEDESADSFEIGAKLKLLDGRARFNISYFNMKFKDLQTTSFTGSTGFIVTNAAAADVQGVEADVTWAVTRDLTLAANAGWIKFEFSDYRGAGCTSAQIALFANAAACSAAGGNDLSGRTNQDVPKFTANFNLRYHPDIPVLREIFVDGSYSDKYFAAADLDPNTIQSSFWKFNAGISVGPRDGPWQLSLIGRNLTNKKTYSFANDVPLFPGSHFAALQRTRSIAARLKLDF